jgi:hypothetical protein
LLVIGASRLTAQTTVSFNFSLASQPVAGWINVAGDPLTGVLVGTDATSGISISSVASADWATSDGNAADGLGAAGGTFFPAAVMLNHWFQFGGAAGVYDATKPQLIISGLHPDSVYTLRMAGSSTTSSNSNPTEYTVAGLIVSGPVAVNSHNNTANGATFTNIAPGPGGIIRVYVNTLATTDVADICGMQVITAGVFSGTAQGLSAGGGLAALGDGIPGSGGHPFTSDRYQHLNGYMYSIGGSGQDPEAYPAFRIYDNGDLTSGTTHNPTLLYILKGLRWFPKAGVLQVGGNILPDTLRTSDATGDAWPGGGIRVNSSGGIGIKGKINDSYIMGHSSSIRTGAVVTNSFVMEYRVPIESTGLSSTFVQNGNILSVQSGLTEAPLDNSFVSGYVNLGGTPTTAVRAQCNFCTFQDTSYASLVTGSSNYVGGKWQFSAGIGNTNKTPAGTMIGQLAVEFTNLSKTGLQGLSAPGLAGYPLFSLGKGPNWHTNAITVLYNGRTQINTEKTSFAITPADVTPKAALEVADTNSGVLLPRLSTAQRNAIVSGDLQNGLLLYNTDSSVFQYYNGTAWSSTAGGLGRWIFSNGMQYDSVDNVGIGTSNTQGYRLAVNGNALITKVKVKAASAWPDYVFRKGYRLPGLERLEQFVSKHRHLPDLPAAAEVGSDGQDVGAGEAALLKKVEELTLYAIELNKKVEELHRANEKLKRKLKKTN